MASNTNREEVKPKTHSQDFIPSFIRKTYDILEEARFPQFIDWNPDGTAIVIKKPSEFSQKVLPIYFKHNNFTSFVRQLNMYDFHKRRTQGLDHVYVHELFQKGKRHLLQEIKRKTHEQAVEKTLKAPETPEMSKTGGEDLSSLIKENQLFKHLYNEAMNRLASLEHRAKELAAQNQSLASQIQRQNEYSGIFKPIISRIESQNELTLDQLPMTMGKMSLNLTSSYQAPAQVTRVYGPNTTGAYLKPSVDLQREESSSVSTEGSHSSPVVIHCGLENENPEIFNPFNNISKVSFTTNTTQVQALKIINELSIARKEISTGQMIDSWNFDFGNEDVLCFADQKTERPNVNTQATYQDKSLLGKRFSDQNADFYGVEPTMKRPELCIFRKRSTISTGVEDQEGAENGFYGVNNVGIDLMEF
jgi:hypothetical protein